MSKKGRNIIYELFGILVHKYYKWIILKFYALNHTFFLFQWI